MEQLSKVIEVFLNVHQFVCFIWGPIKFLLGISRTYLDSFDKLLDAYAQVGEVMRGLADYQTTFEKYPTLAYVLEDYYFDILEFHKAALPVFRRPKHLESEKASATLYEIQRVRQDIAEFRAENMQQIAQENLEKHKQRVLCIQEKLRAPNYQTDQEMSTEARSGKDSGKWFFKDPKFQEWLTPTRPGHGVLYIHGMPGAGKTTLVSAIVEKLLDETRLSADTRCMAYFYFKHNQPDKESHNSLLRAILEQLISRDAILSDHLFEQISSAEGVNLRSSKTLDNLIRASMENYEIAYVVIDGLDETTQDESEKTVNWLLSLITRGLGDAKPKLRVLICGQRDGLLDKVFAPYPSMSLETSGHQADIREYCQRFCARIRAKFDIQPSIEDDIVSRVVSEAQGMFLYARVVLENLLNQTRLTQLKKEMEHETFPKGIEKAYERVAVRIFEESSTAEREDALKLIGWVTHARRLLRWREIQSFFCIDPVIGDVDYEERKLRVTCKELCGSLVDVHHATDMKDHPEASIRIVHETAREKWLDSGIEHAKLAVFCSRYLTSKSFACGVDAQDVATYATKGFYGLQDYAVQYWFDHFWEYMKMAPALDPSQTQEVIEAAAKFLKSYGLPSKVKMNFKKDGDQGVLQALKLLPEDECERNEHLNIEIRTCLIRQTIEALHQTDAIGPEAQEVFANLHGTIATYKCSKPWCHFFSSGLQSADDRKRHADKHDLPFQCHFEDCFAFQLGYDTQSKLDQHMREHHPQPNDEAQFPEVANKKINLLVAAEKGNLALVETLLDSGEDPNVRARRKGTTITPLYLAAAAGHFKVCKLLLEKGGKIMVPHRGAALYKTVREGDRDVLQLLLNEGQCLQDVSQPMRQELFCEACARGDLDVVKLLFGTGELRVDQRPGSHPDSYDNPLRAPLTPLYYACVMGHGDVVRYLLQQDSPVEFDYETLIEADQRGYEATVDLVLSAAKDDTSFSYERLGQTPTTSISLLGARVAELRYSQTPALNISYANAMVKIWDVRSGTIHHIWGISGSGISCLQFSHDSRLLSSGDYHSTVRFYDVESSANIRTLTIEDGLPRTVFAISLGAAIFVTRSNDERLKIWDSTNGSIIKILEGANSPIDSLILSEDGRRLLCCVGNGHIKLWDLSYIRDTSPEDHGGVKCINTLRLPFVGHSLVLLTLGIN
ncbi:hypothetical protein DL765_006510 [Monosporascus sp. GIB2]|nr:hypothetical protein DL765_006510 [Monosporascus sp. GIB2]